MQRVEARSTITRLATLAANVGAKAVKVNVVKATKAVSGILDEAADTAPVKPMFNNNPVC
jgi:hypothetical protein